MGQGKKPEGKKRVASRDGFRREFIQFLVLFFALWLFSYLLTKRYPGFIVSAQLLVAREVEFILNLIGYKFSVTGSSFLFETAHGGENLVVIAECTGIYTSIIYFSIVGAYPARAGEKIVGLLMGIPSIHVMNLARMIFISLVLYHKRELFDFFHGYLWQIGFVIFMLFLVILWMGRIVKGGVQSRTPVSTDPAED